MNKSVKNYLIGSIASYIVVMLVVIALADKTEQAHVEEKAIPSTTSTTAPRTIPVSTFPKKETTDKIPNPCEVLQLSDVQEFVIAPITERGPIIQDSIAPSKLCEWSTEDVEFPRLGISIVLSATFFDNSEGEKLSDLSVGDKSFSVDGYVTGFGGTNCGKTAIVKNGEFSFAVALCKENDKEPTNEELEKLSKEVEASLG